MILGVIGWQPTNLSETLLMLGVIIGTVGALTIPWVWVGLLITTFTFNRPTESQREQSALYASDLRNLKDWSKLEYEGLQVSEHRLRDIATKILVSQAIEVVKLQRAAGAATEPMESLDHFFSGGARLTKLKTMLVVLNRLSIADLDDKPIFSRANKLLDEQERGEREAVAPEHGAASLTGTVEA